MDWTTCDLADEHGDAARVLPVSLRHFGGARRFTGVVATVRCLEDNTHLKALANTPGNGRVIVVDGGGSLRCALLGDTIAGEALDHGWAGIVVWGCVRDTAALAALELGVMGLAPNPRRSGKAGAGDTGVELELDGVVCAPGDVLHADEDGVLLIQRS